jgi:hypothetical protein
LILFLFLEKKYLHFLSFIKYSAQQYNKGL